MMTELGSDAVAVAALAVYALYLGVGFGLRTWVQWRRTGDTGWRGISASSGRIGDTIPPSGGLESCSPSRS